MSEAGLVIVISGPGGVGKSTVVNRLIEKYPELVLSRSWTTRDQRPGEADTAYNFVSTQEFEAHIEAGGFLEHTNFLGNYYGTPTPKVGQSEDLILEIEVDGARQVTDKVPGALLLFLQAPSVEEQTMRLTKRGDSPEKIEARLAKSAEEITAGAELGAQVIINSELEDTVNQLWQAIQDAKAQRS